MSGLTVRRVGNGLFVSCAGVDAVITDDGEVQPTALPPPGTFVIADVFDVIARAIRERADGWFHVHAGTVAFGDRVVLIAGDSGHGKTTTTLALEAAGGVRCGDDVAFVRHAGEDLLARAMLRPLHLGIETAAMFPELEPTASRLSLAGKAIVDGGGDERVGRVAAIVFPRIDRRPGTTTSACASSASEALQRLLVASAMVAWPGLRDAQTHLDTLAFAATLPAIAVTLGADALTSPAKIADAVFGALAW